MNIKLKKSILHKGEEISTINLDLESLTGNDLIEVEENIKKDKNLFIVTFFDSECAIALAARAAHIPVEALKNMNARDFNKIVGEVRTFLGASDSSEEENEAEIPVNNHAIS